MAYKVVRIGYLRIGPQVSVQGGEYATEEEARQEALSSIEINNLHRQVAGRGKSQGGDDYVVCTAQVAAKLLA